MKKPLNAYVKEHYRSDPSGSGRLDGLVFAVKDVFALKGHTNTAGNPYWARTHSPAERHAAVITALLREGAALRGITITDELMYSLHGENLHYGTPLNPAAPDALPGGSSSGSAAAVAAGLADFALGTDTGGSVRIPSSYCGLYGFRPTSGAVTTEGVIPLADSFDTVGWMARDPELLRRVGEVLLPGGAEGSAEGLPADGWEPELVAPSELWGLADEAVRERLKPAADRLVPVRTPPGTYDPERNAEAFRILQGYEIHRRHGPWIERTRPRLAPDIAERLAWAATLRREDYERELAYRAAFREQQKERLRQEAVLLIPTAPCAAPLLGLCDKEMARIRGLLLVFTSLAGLAGLPQVTLPVPPASGRGRPVGLSLIGGPGTDLPLLRLAERLSKKLNEADRGPFV